MESQLVMCSLVILTGFDKKYIRLIQIYGWIGFCLREVENHRIKLSTAHKVPFCTWLKDLLCWRSLKSTEKSLTISNLMIWLKVCTVFNFKMHYLKCFRIYKREITQRMLQKSCNYRSSKLGCYYLQLKGFTIRFFCGTYVHCLENTLFMCLTVPSPLLNSQYNLTVKSKGLLGRLFPTTKIILNPNFLYSGWKIPRKWGICKTNSNRANMYPHKIAY